MSDEFQTITPDASSPLEQIETTSWSTLLAPSLESDTPEEDNTPLSINAESFDEYDEIEDETGDDEIAEEEDDDPDIAVPFHQHPRWQEVLGERNALRQELESARAWDPIVEQLRSQGFETPEQVHAAVMQQQEDARQDAEVRQHLNAEVQAGRIAPEYAQQLYQHQMELQRQQQELSAAVARIQNSEAELEMADAQRKYPGMDPEYVWTMHQSTGLPVHHIAEISSARAMALRQQAVSEYIAQQARLGQVPTPEGKGGAAPSPQKTNDPWKLPSFSVLLGMGKGT